VVGGWWGLAGYAKNGIRRRANQKRIREKKGGEREIF